MDEENQVILNTKLGRLRGRTTKSTFSGKNFYAFQGIPYAKPPIGELRFKAPQPFGGWDGIRDAMKDGNDAKQAFTSPVPGTGPKKLTDGDEACLFLNVYINELPEKSHSLKPVMFSIHGGGYQGGSGSSEAHGPDHLLNEDIIVVSINYRCGAFGFLSLETEEVPGNAGLKDQTLALEWVRDNIHSFGGDPHNVTIFGISAGGASVSFHLLSPLSKGLFHKAIIQSGFAMNPWAIRESPQDSAVELAQTLGCSSDDPTQVLAFLQSVSAEDIVIATRKVIKSKNSPNNLGMLVFAPSVEIAGSNPFIAETPQHIMQKGEFNKVPVVLGGSLNDGNVIAIGSTVNDEVLSQINANNLVPYFLKLEPGSLETKEVSEAIKEFYFEGNPLSWDNIKDFLAYLSDYVFNLGLVQTRAKLLEKSLLPVYTYVFADHSRCYFCSILNNNKSGMQSFLTEDTCHAAEVAMLYDLKKAPLGEMSSSVKEAVQKLVKSWANFAAFGNPSCKEMNINWEEDSKSTPRYLHIGKQWEMTNGIPFQKRVSFWENLISKYCR